MNVKEAIQTLQKHGFKMTNRREHILHFFAKEDKYFTAKELYTYMEATFPGISFDTVYRNLHLYDDLGVLESTELKGEKHFRMNCGTTHHHHFICNDCGKAKKIHLCPMDEVERILAAYKIDGHKFEVYGLCPTCQSA